MYDTSRGNDYQFWSLHRPYYRGTGMIVSSSTSRTHPGRVIRYMLHAIQHGTEALVYINHPREAAACCIWP